jgi:TolB protein
MNSAKTCILAILCVSVVCGASQSPNGIGAPNVLELTAEIAYEALGPESPLGAGLDIFVVRPDGTGQRRLTTDPDSDMSPVWSPDGRQIAFVSLLHASGEQRKALQEAQAARRIGPPLQQVFVMDGDGSNPTQVTRNGGLAPAWSPDGRQLAFVGAADWRADDSIREWSAKRDIFVVDADGQNLRSITSQVGSDNNPAWSPDGRSIAFAAHREAHAWAEIYVMNADGSNPRRLTFNSPGKFEECCDDNFPRWSPDGRWISFVSKRDGNSELYKMRPDGTEQTRLTRHPGFDAYASWSPSGQFLVFTHRTERTGFGSLFIMRADGSDLRPVGVVGRLGSWRPSK